MGPRAGGTARRGGGQVRQNLNQGLMDDEIAFEWDTEKMKSMTREQLWPIFHGWGEFTWDNSNGYNVEVIKTQVQA